MTQRYSSMTANSGSRISGSRPALRREPRLMITRESGSVAIDATRFERTKQNPRKTQSSDTGRPMFRHSVVAHMRDKLDRIRGLYRRELPNGTSLRVGTDGCGWCIAATSNSDKSGESISRVAEYMSRCNWVWFDRFGIGQDRRTDCLRGSERLGRVRPATATKVRRFHARD